MFEGSRNYDGTYLSDANVGFDPFSDDGKVLTIVATPGTTPSGAPYFGGVISSAGSFSQAFGYFEMRAQLPVGAGLWPAFWMYPETGYGIRELDVLEAFGAPYQGQGSLTEYHAAMHDSSLPNTQAGGWVSTVPSGTNITEGFHTYGMLWTPTTTTYYFDGQQTEQLPTPADMTVPMYMMANNAVGGAGTWPGPTAGETGAMYVDYIRVFSNDASAPAVTMEPLSSPDGGGNNLYGATLPN
jgi:beta-glucanase (GH16 family)